jgi:UDP:flavonoid glycosyltransferase YjiC (YdhE family)
MDRGLNCPDRSLASRVLHRRPRVLFVGEALTLCHVARPLALAHTLRDHGYDVHLACDSRYHHLASDVSWINLHPLASQSREQTLRRVWLGQPMFTNATLRRYVREDLALIERVRPDLIVGDMRLSLSASARVRGVPYFAVTNAYWSPFSNPPVLTPDSILSRLVGFRTAKRMLRFWEPRIQSAHCRPHNRMRRRYGLPPISSDVRNMMTDADHVLYADAPELIPTREMTAGHHFVGPILWSYPAPLPEWWDRLPSRRPVVFVALGSSGNVRLAPIILEALERLPVTVIIATLGRTRLKRIPANAFVTKYLPAEPAVRRSQLLVSHGGSASSYVALGAGIPILGLPSNLDQHLTMHYVRRAGAGVLVRAEQATVREVRNSVRQLLEEARFVEAARRMAEHFRGWRVEQRFPDLLAEELRRPSRQRAA